MTLEPQVARIGTITVYFGSGAPADNTIFNKNDVYIRTGDVAAGQAWLYVATAASGTWKALDALDS